MSGLVEEIQAFKKQKAEIGKRAGQTAAFFLASGIDLDHALAAPPPERDRIIVRLQRLIERERLRGARRHWSYDLNRHIALKQALDRLRPTGNENGARRAPQKS